ncbi:hypothetical protein [Celeribacter halophilus]|uniref:Uncharacterized protein n=1 Tax=Celeribacter halophilus TaxID=576117 RepID=A0A1I3WWW6_9RHOB|nr:hypothetical protein [Celeribacter halophilus]PZX04752.1 hypothetical protein LX82_03601 [Celeribacter halophilus]SFK11975.1 hypothetical protein SAMN04488138_13316 [Celeribacter halophilus]
MEIQKIEKSLDTLAILIANHCIRWRLAELGVEQLSVAQRRAVVTATLDYFEHLMERVQPLSAGNSSLSCEGATDIGPQRSRFDAHSFF